MDRPWDGQTDRIARGVRGVRDAPVGIACAASELVVIDADLYKPDCEFFPLSERLGDLPPTLTQNTPRDGRHYFFRDAGGVEYRNPCVAVEAKHQGYVLAYGFVDESVPLAALPDAWLDHLTKPKWPRGGAGAFWGILARPTSKNARAGAFPSEQPPTRARTPRRVGFSGRGWRPNFSQKNGAPERPPDSPGTVQATGYVRGPKGALDGYLGRRRSLSLSRRTFEGQPGGFRTRRRGSRPMQRAEPSHGPGRDIGVLVCASPIRLPASLHPQHGHGLTFDHRAKVRAKQAIALVRYRYHYVLLCERRELKPNGARQIVEETALVRVRPDGECTDGHESSHFVTCSRSFVRSTSEEELGAAIAAVTRALASSHERGEVLELARERAALRHELAVLQENEGDRAGHRVA